MAIDPSSVPDIDPRVGPRPTGSSQTASPTGSSQTAGATGSSRSTPFLPDDMDPELKKLIAELEQGNPPPEPLTKWQVLGAKLVRLGSGLQGGPANERSGAEIEKAEEEESYRAGKRAVAGLKISDAYKRDAEKRAAAEQIRKEERENAIAERTKINSEYSDLLDTKDPKLYDLIPANFDIGKATMADILNIKKNYLKVLEPSLNEDDNMAATLATIDTLKKIAPELGNDPNPSVHVSGKKVTATLNRQDPSQQSTRVQTASGLTPDQLAKHSLKLAQNVADWPLSKITQALGELGSERKNWVKFSAAEAKEFATYDEISESTDELYDLIKDTGVGGAATFGFATNQEAADFRAKSLNIRDILERIRTGATTNPRDTSTYDTLYAKLGNFTRNNLAALKEVSAFVKDLSKRRLGYKMVPESQRRYIRLLNNGVDIDANEQDEEMPDLPDNLLGGP